MTESRMRTFTRREFLGLGAAAGAVLTFGGCAGGAASSDRLTIAYQPSLIGYAQFIVMKQEGWLREELPDVEVSWQQLGSGAAIRDSVLAGEVQVGAGGIGPFLVGVDGGAGWKMLSALCDVDLWLMVNEDRFRSLEDFGPDDKIAMPAPDSIQSVILRKGAEEQLGDPRALDENIVSLEEPDSLRSLVSGQVAGHVTGVPFRIREEDEGARPILKSFDLFGGSHNSNSVWVRQEQYDANPEAMQTLYRNIERATELCRSDPARVAESLGKESGGEISAKEFESYMPEMEFTIEPHGFIKFAEFMRQADMVEEVPASWKDLVYDNLKSTNGS